MQALAHCFGEPNQHTEWEKIVKTRFTCESRKTDCGWPMCNIIVFTKRTHAGVFSRLGFSTTPLVCNAI